ncbi:hypothetical protein AVEN_184309-1 [Araneus ventricosus]|uniref:Uncharacterized protein n=1 Tax=Araneus ventricosus TaxID=182803 RepID=A0A4Y2K3U6_ARAVE|nr:hypothetical protein AVEN_184309-1 [Araneus ventricosus]
MMRTPESVPPLQSSISHQREGVCPSCLKCTRPYAWWTLVGIEFHNSPVPNLTVYQIDKTILYKENTVREHLTGPQHYPDNGLVSENIQNILHITKWLSP